MAEQAHTSGVRDRLAAMAIRRAAIAIRRASAAAGLWDSSTFIRRARMRFI
jgi:hypothetical protein